jgi:transcriptional regulator with XRE-family HTH domain
MPGVRTRVPGLRPEVRRLRGNTLGAKLKRRRIELNLFAYEAAERMGVCEEALYKWENDMCEPQAHLWPRVIAFLGYEPWPKPVTSGERLRAERLRRGLSMKRAALHLDIDEATFGGWERRGRSPTLELRTKRDRFLAGI